jgi:hypothetical protein
MYFRRKTSAGRAYLQIVESRRDGDQVRQQVIATLGRFDELQASGQLERLVRSGARFAAKAVVLSAASNDAAIKIAVRRIGPALMFERLWEETGCRAVIAELVGKRKHGFALERAVFLTVLHRLFVSGSDRAADRCRGNRGNQPSGVVRLSNLSTGKQRSLLRSILIALGAACAGLLASPATTITSTEAVVSPQTK